MADIISSIKSACEEYGYSSSEEYLNFLANTVNLIVRHLTLFRLILIRLYLSEYK